ncbi:hypothetical protein DXG01_005565 [Tephrocybe rancida]|nr:hypothetical protein DXG01_005565 [Tephrocybe rancida]
MSFVRLPAVLILSIIGLVICITLIILRLVSTHRRRRALLKTDLESTRDKLRDSLDLQDGTPERYGAPDAPPPGYWTTAPLSRPPAAMDRRLNNTERLRVELESLRREREASQARTRALMEDVSN